MFHYLPSPSNPLLHNQITNAAGTNHHSICATAGWNTTGIAASANPPENGKNAKVASHALTQLKATR